MNILITGGSGFIGSAVIRKIIGSEKSLKVTNIDLLTYAGNSSNLASVQGSKRYTFIKIDIRDLEALELVFQKYQPDLVLHLAAESHVDRSIDSPFPFISTNIIGTFNLLECSRRHFNKLPFSKKESFRFYHVSTDEVFGSLGQDGFFDETSRYAPNSPYSASKASSDHLVRSWGRTYGLPVVITNCTNNYGPYQYPEKLIPLMILNALDGKKLPVYGTGNNIRDWIHVDDHAQALLNIIQKSPQSDQFNIGGLNEVSNIEIVNQICGILDNLIPAKDGSSYTNLITFVQDRPGHDIRYAVDISRIKREIGWEPQTSFENGLAETIKWYISERNGWCKSMANSNARSRIGVGKDVGIEI